MNGEKWAQQDSNTRGNAGKDADCSRGAPESAPMAAAEAPATPPIPVDPGLAAVVAAWPELPPAIRAGVVAMVKAANTW